MRAKNKFRCGGSQSGSCGRPIGLECQGRPARDSAVPKSVRVDSILERQGDDAWFPDGERPYVDDEKDASADEAWSDDDAEDDT